MRMFLKPKLAAALITAMATTLAVPAVASRDGDDSRSRAGNCSRHAGLLFRACMADREDDWLVHKADCIYVTEREDKRSCLADARGEKRDKADECDEVYNARLEVCDLLGERRFDIEFDPEEFVHPDDIGDGIDPNPYFPLTAGHTHVIVGGGEVTVVTATDRVRYVGEEADDDDLEDDDALPCRVVRDLVFEETVDGVEVEYDATEVTQDWYAQHTNGDVVYCGENTYEIEDGLIDNTDGSFANGTDRALAGFLVRANPVVGEGDRQEMASDEAEDIVEYVSLAATPPPAEGGEGMIPCSGNCLKTFELNPRDPGVAEFKYYKPGAGFVLAVKIDEDRNPIGEREDVTCVKNSLAEALADPMGCGIADPDALAEAICLWAPTISPLCTDE